MVKNPPAMWRPGLDPWIWKIPWRREWQPTLVFLPGESPWTEEPGRLMSMGSQKVRHDWVTKYTQCWLLLGQLKLNTSKTKWNLMIYFHNIQRLLLVFPSHSINLFLGPFYVLYTIPGTGPQKWTMQLSSLLSWARLPNYTTVKRHQSCCILCKQGCWVVGPFSWNWTSRKQHREEMCLQ